PNSLTSGTLVINELVALDLTSGDFLKDSRAAENESLIHFKFLTALVVQARPASPYKERFYQILPRPIHPPYRPEDL
ncbi:hypothetical protein, partial [Streptococcus suis]|uniref:hypothetical protein n=1 Tax=Streptococcus suis TaxID=1307 RepID=UPI000516E072